MNMNQNTKHIAEDLYIAFINLLNCILMTAAAGILVYAIDEHKKMDGIVPLPLGGELPGTSIHSRMVLSLIIFFFLYLIFARVYQALRISTSKVSELIYSQVLACILSDIMLYFILWLISGRFVRLRYLFLALLVQFILASLWSYVCNRLYFKTHKPRKTMLIFRNRSQLEAQINAYRMEKKFKLDTIYHIDDILEDTSILSDYETVFLSDVSSSSRNDVLKYCVSHHIQVFCLPTIGDTLMSSATPMHLFHLPFLEINGYRPSPIYLFFKRCFDIIVSLTAMVVLSPIFLITAIAIKATDGGPVFYKQERMTQYGRNFMIHKFRSMRVDAESDGKARLSTGANDSRITPVGKFIRACRIDELPQLIDILKGDLSIVGPRPEREAIAAEYEKVFPEFRLRLLAKAGLTGYAQVYGKYNSTPHDKLQMDLMYIAHPGIIQDLKICFATIKILFLPESTEGIAEGSVTAMDTASSKEKKDKAASARSKKKSEPKDSDYMD